MFFVDKFFRRFAATPAPTMPPPVRNDTADTLQALEREQQDVTGRLAIDEVAWTVLEPRRDPGSHIERSRLAPQIRDRRARVAALAAAIEKAEKDVRVTAAKVVEYDHRVGEARASISPLLDRLPTDAEMAAARDRGRRLSALAAELLARTGDRRYRHVPADPFFALRDALSDRLDRLDRIRHARATPGRVDATVS